MGKKFEEFLRVYISPGGDRPISSFLSWGTGDAAKRFPLNEENYEKVFAKVEGENRAGSRPFSPIGKRFHLRDFPPLVNKVDCKPFKIGRWEPPASKRARDGFSAGDKDPQDEQKLSEIAEWARATNFGLIGE